MHIFVFEKIGYRLFSCSIGLESNPVKDLTPSSEGTPVNGGAMSLSSKKFHGYVTTSFSTSFCFPSYVLLHIIEILELNRGNEIVERGRSWNWQKNYLKSSLILEIYNFFFTGVIVCLFLNLHYLNVIFVLKL